MMNKIRVCFMVASAAFFIASAHAQNSGTVTNHAVPIGKGAGVTGFNSAVPGTTGQPLVSNGASSDPSFKVLPTGGGGTGADNSTNSANDILASNGANGTFVHTVLATLINSACTVTPSLCSLALGYYSPYWFGARCDGSTDDTTALNNAVAAATGGRLLMPAATCIVSNTITLVSNFSLSGVNRDLSIIKSTACLPVLTVTDINNVTVETLWLQGSDACISWAVGNIGALKGNISSSFSNWTFRNIRQSGFNSNYWNLIVQTGGIFKNLTIDGMQIDTTVSDVPSGANNPNIGIQIQSAAGGLRMENTTISRSQINGADLCIHIILFSNFYKYAVKDNRLLSPGGANTGSHCTNGGTATNAYGITLYDLNNDGNPMQDGLVTGNYILNPIAAGIYCVAGSALTRAATTTPMLIADNEIIGQTHTDTLLPRGAIALNSCTDLVVANNKLRNNLLGLNLGVQTAGTLSVFGNDCYSGVGSSVCLQLQSGSNGSSNTDVRTIRGNYFESGGNSVNMLSATGARFNNLDISGNTIVADSASAGAGLLGASQWVSGMFNLKDNTFFGPSSTAMLNIGSLTGNLGLMGNTFNTPAGAGGILFANLPTAVNGSQVYIQDGTAASAPCTGAGTGSTAMRQNGAWKCF